MIAPGSSKIEKTATELRSHAFRTPVAPPHAGKPARAPIPKKSWHLSQSKGRNVSMVYAQRNQRACMTHTHTHTESQHEGFSVRSRWCICPRPTGGDIFSRFEKSLRWHRIGNCNKNSYNTHILFHLFYHTNAKYLQNKLLLISKNVTPKNSHSCLTKWVHYVFHVFLGTQS